MSEEEKELIKELERKSNLTSNNYEIFIERTDIMTILNYIDKLQKELNNRIPKEQIEEKKNWYQETMKHLCKNGIDLDRYERYEEVVNFCKELLGE